MNSFQYLLLVYAGLTFVSVVSSLPARSRARRLGNSSDRHRTRPAGKRLKILQRVLRQLQPGDMEWLLRQKKFTNLFTSQINGHKDIELRHDMPDNREIECPTAEDGVPLFACPSSDQHGYYRCIDEHALCDNIIHCPNGEDENKTVCMFHKTTMRYFRIIMDAIYGLSRTLV